MRGGVFICHASEDASMARRVVRVLEDADIPCWIAPRDIEPGESYAGAILDGLEVAPATVLIFSSAANTSPHVSREVETAVSGGQPIIPVQCEQVDPSRSLRYFIGTAHWLQTVGVPEPTWAAQLVRAVRRVLDGQLKVDPQPSTTNDESTGRHETAFADPPPTIAGPPRGVPTPRRNRRRTLLATGSVALLTATVIALAVLADRVGEGRLGDATDEQAQSDASSIEPQPTESSSNSDDTDSSQEGEDSRPVTCWDATTAAGVRLCPTPKGRSGMATVFRGLDRLCNEVPSPVQGKAEVYECEKDGFVVRYTRWAEGYDKYSYYDFENQVTSSPWSVDGEEAGWQWLSIEPDLTESQRYQWSAAFRQHPFSVSVEGETSADRSAGVAALEVSPPSSIGLE